MSVGTGSIKRAAANAAKETKAAEPEKAALDAAEVNADEETIVSAETASVEKKPAKVRSQKSETGKKAQTSKPAANKKSSEKAAKKKRQEKPASAKQEKKPNLPKNAGGYEAYGIGQPLPIHLL